MTTREQILYIFPIRNEPENELLEKITEYFFFMAAASGLASPGEVLLGRMAP